MLRLWLALVGVALAHARLVGSEPVDGAALEDPPETVELWFNGEVERRFHRVALIRPDRTTEELVVFVPDEADRTRLGVRLPQLGPGEWAIDWDVVSRDGHRVDGRLRFVVKEPPPTVPLDAVHRGSPAAAPAPR